MRILINGLPLFSRRLADDLCEADPSSQFIFLDTYNSKWEQLRFLLLLPFSDAVISMNGVSDRSGILDAVLFFRKKLIMQWQGTDVLNALKRKANGTLNRKYIDRAFHFTDCSWLADELNEAGISTELLNYKWTRISATEKQYDGITVLTYVAERRQSFYGMDWIIQLAESFPEINFKVFGTAIAERKLPKNILLFGWTEHAVFLEEMKRTPIFLRLAEHDGFSVSVIEALGCGCEIMMRFPYTNAIKVSSAKEAVEGLKTLTNRILARGMTPSSTNLELAKREFNKSSIIGNYLQTLKKLVQATG